MQIKLDKVEQCSRHWNSKQEGVSVARVVLSLSLLCHGCPTRTE